MKISFRVDGNNIIGWGHVMRSLSIASAANYLGVECFFICADDEMKGIIEKRGFSVFVLNSDFDNLVNELDLLVDLINREQPNYLFVDSYYVSNEYFDEIKKHVKTVYIDDVFDFPYNVDYLVNYNIYAYEAKYRDLYKNNNIPKLILGPKYAPLRDEFKNVFKEYRDEVKSVFVSTGGSDEHGIVLKIINKLCESDYLVKGIDYHFIIGGFEPDKDVIYDLAKQYCWIKLHEQVNNMSEIMKGCDVAVSAAGSTLYELCACGVPTVTYVFADNQINGADEFSRLGLMISAGDIRKTSYECDSILYSLRKIIEDSEMRTSISNKMKNVVDGNGAERIIKRLNSII